MVCESGKRSRVQANYSWPSGCCAVQVFLILIKANWCFLMTSLKHYSELNILKWKSEAVNSTWRRGYCFNNLEEKHFGFYMMLSDPWWTFFQAHRWGDRSTRHHPHPRNRITVWRSKLKCLWMMQAGSRQVEQAGRHHRWNYSTSGASLGCCSVGVVHCESVVFVEPL